MAPAKSQSIKHLLARRFYSLRRYISYYSSLNVYHFWAGLLVALINAPIESVIIYVSGKFIDSIVTFYSDSQYFTIGSLSIPLPFQYVFLLVVLFVAQRIFNALIDVSSFTVNAAANTQSKQNIVEKFNKLNLEEVDREDIKDEIEKVQSISLARMAGIYDRIVDLLDLAVNIIAAFTLVTIFSPALAFLLVLVPLPEVLAIANGNQTLREYINRIAPMLLQRSYIISVLLDTRTFAERKINGIHKLFEHRLHYTNHTVEDGQKSIEIANTYKKTFAGVFDICIVFILRVGTILISISEKVAVGKIVATLEYMDSLYRKMFQIQSTLLKFSDDLSYAEAYFDVMDISGFADRKPGSRLLQDGVPKIELKKVSFAYPETKFSILSEADLTINPGEKIMILGRDGSGKSSLLRIMSGLYKSQRGQVFYDGIPLSKIKRRLVKEKLSIVSEDFARYYVSLKQNILLDASLREFDEELYKKVLKIANLDEWVVQHDIDREDITIGGFFTGGVEISSGHWQRIAIARALYRNRDVFVFDQPFAYIDHASIRAIFYGVMEFIKDRTFIMIDEQVIFPEYFDAFYEVKAGKIEKISKEKAIAEWTVGK